MEKKIYLIPTFNVGFLENITDKEFVEIAKEEGQCYSLNEFQNLYNTGYISKGYYIRFL